MTTALLADLLLAAALAGAAPAPAPGASAPAVPGHDVAASTKPVVLTPSHLYTAERLRDPFLKGGGAGGRALKTFTPEDFNIHNLTLKGIMKDGGQAFGLFSDESFGVRFILRGGRLLDGKGKPVAGVTGKLDPRLKTAHLMTPEGDVQVFKLGGEKDEEER